MGIASAVFVGMALALSLGGVLSPVQFDLVFCAACGVTAIAFMARLGVKDMLAYGLAVVAIGGLAVARLNYPGILLAPYLAIALVNGFIAYMFARNLLPGRDSLILQVVRLIGAAPESTEEFRRFVYWQSALWAIFGTVTSMAGIVAMFYPSLRPHANAALGVFAVVQVVWFVFSHRHANRRYGRPETWLDTVRVFSNPGLWARLDI